MEKQDVTENPPGPASTAEAQDGGHVSSGVDRVVLVDERDVAIGTADKLSAHQDGGQLHRAFSVVLFDAEGRMLIQQRAATKYHFPLLWTNACCSHPRPGEAVEAAAHRRMAEELGIEARIERAFFFLYEADDPVSGLSEREYDHVFVGQFDGEIEPDPQEVAAVSLRSPRALLRDIRARPDDYTPWFREVLGQLEERGLLEAAGRKPLP